MEVPVSDEHTPLSVRIPMLFGALKYRLRLILIVLVVVFAGSAAYIEQMPNVYRAQTQILVNPQRISDKYVSSAVSMGASDRLNTLSQQILSASRLEKILDDFQLFPKLRGKVSREELIERMRKNIGIELKHNADGLSAFTLSYTGDSAKEVAAVANKLADSFITWNLQDREQEAQGTTAFLANELVTTKTQLDALENQLSAYKLRHLGELPDQLQANMQTLSRLQVELQANVEGQSRLDHEALLAASASPDPVSQRTPGPSSNPRQRLVSEKLAAQAELAELRKHYTDSFPDVIQKQAEIHALDERIAATPVVDAAALSSPDAQPTANPQLQLIRRDRARLVSEQRNIQASISRYQSKVDSAPLREQEISQLLRDYDTTKDHYRSLLEKNYSAQMAAQLEHDQKGGSFTMLDSARVPDIPTGPKRMPLLIGAFCLALILAGGTAFVSEMMDSTVKSELELRDCLPGIPLLGITPTMERTQMRRVLAPARYLLGGQ
ncbi:lipopolysaccharide biosynthesis protein [Terriglobus albidus]|uniref:Lipopolysaccharide biosynthesis protein n=1 Tax=Terriglobus albidus TaxID=1592106 RepID=A0A5B9EBQ5_9BACT|nr:lipopolysaccharide biosynthesis protein [Terriglobus albidus]